MIKRVVVLFKIGRKLAQSEILDIFSKFHKVPILIKVLFYLLSFSIKKKNEVNCNIDDKERLSSSLQSMGTTFIKLGQFLATRPDIIGENLSKQLEKLQDKLPPFPLSDTKTIIKSESKRFIRSYYF